MKHLFFDLDGTLTDSKEGIMRAYAYALDAYGIPYGSYTDFERVVGPPIHGCFVQDGIAEEDTAAAIRKFQEYYAERGIWENRVYGGIAEALAALKEKGARLYVVTAKPHRFAVQIIERFGLSPFFESVTGADMSELHCDKALLLQSALTRHSLLPDAKSMAMIGDRSYDIIGAKAVGMRACGVLWGIGSREELEGAGADILLGKPSSLSQLADA
jgi:phosphoglycolate phosphatase